MGHGSFSDKGKCHFLKLTCNMGDPHQESLEVHVF